MTNVYKLRFDDERQSEVVLGAVLANLKPIDVSIKTLGVHKEYTVNEDDPEGEPTVIEYDGWHVDIVSSVPLEIPEQFIKNPKPEEVFHMFA